MKCRPLMSMDRLIGTTLSLVVHGVLLFTLGTEPLQGMQTVSHGKPYSLEIYFVHEGQSDAATGDLASSVLGDIRKLEITEEKPKGLRIDPPAKSDDGKLPVVQASLESGSETSTSAAFEEFSAYQRRLLDHIRPFQAYPEEGSKRRLSGTVQVGFVLRRDGTVEDLWVETSSGHPVLDVAALDTIRRAEPLPHIPTGLPETVSVLLPVAFAMPYRAEQG